MKEKSHTSIVAIALATAAGITTAAVILTATIPPSQADGSNFNFHQFKDKPLQVPYSQTARDAA